jgi:phosphomannomutase
MQTPFKAYDIRGRVPNELDAELAWRIGTAYAGLIRPESVVVGRDIRPSSDALSDAVIAGLRDAGVTVYDIGLCGTEEVYFATGKLGAGGGIMITASHNPPDYNGMKLVREEARPISSDNGLREIEVAVRKTGTSNSRMRKGDYHKVDLRQQYVEHVLGLIEIANIPPLHVVANAGNGCAGPTFDAIAERLPIKVTRILHTPDGSFPSGVPNPLLPENRNLTSQTVIDARADIGIAWDGDFDRCFLFDEHGDFVESYYLVGLLAQGFLEKYPGANIVHDPRLVWNTLDVVAAAGGRPVLSRCGHAFIKDVMRSADAVYGGEMSAHHYFREFFYCDSGMIPWLLILELLGKKHWHLSSVVRDRLERFPVSGEINRSVEDAETAIARVENFYKSSVINVERCDGLSMEFVDWRFNLRSSNTEPLLRLNVETRNNREVLDRRTREILGIIEKT